jgi:hypothetical protein
VITHAVTKGGYDLTLKNNGKLLARVVKDDGGYAVVDGEAFWLLEKVTYPTMAALKDALRPLVPAEMRIKNKRSWRPTQTDARMAGGSHARTGAAIREMCILYPEKSRIPGWINAALIYMHMEGVAASGYAPAQNYLDNHFPPAGYSKADFHRRCVQLYGPQPEYCW